MTVRKPERERESQQLLEVEELPFQQGFPLKNEASPHKRELKCDTKHQSQEADATFITSDGHNSG